MQPFSVRHLVGVSARLFGPFSALGLVASLACTASVATIGETSGTTGGATSTDDGGGSTGTADSGESGDTTAVNDAHTLAVVDGHTCVLWDAGEVECWGAGMFDPGRPGFVASPPPPPGTAIAGLIDDGYARVCGITDDGNALCWREWFDDGLEEALPAAAADDPYVGLAADYNLTWGLLASGGVVVRDHFGGGSSVFPDAAVTALARRNWSGGLPMAGIGTEGELVLLPAQAEDPIVRVPLALPATEALLIAATDDAGGGACALLVDGSLSCFSMTGDPVDVGEALDAQQGDVLVRLAPTSYGSYAFCGVRSDGSARCFDGANGTTAPSG